jgi:tRNA-2-methylthio-N6-dimethylallyladenosine synthase
MPLRILSDEPTAAVPPHHQDMVVGAAQGSLPAPAQPRPAKVLSPETHPHGLFIETFGCQMNAHDTERLRELLEPHGYRSVASETDASLIILNSCDIREKSEHKLMSALGRYKDLKREKAGLVLAVAGCVAQVEGEKIMRRAPYVDLVVGTDQLRKVPDMVARVKAGASHLVENAFWDPADGLESDTAFVGAQADYQPGEVTAFVTAMTGCDKKCAYCIVPFTRGKERSRPLDSIVDEVKLLVSKGVREVMLIGQTVNTYGLDFETKSPRFADLLRAVHAVPDLQRIRFMTSHPRDMTDDLIAALHDLPKVCGHLHLPVQAGSNRTLQRMGRAYTREWYLERVARIRAARPDISITSDIIVGFPGETEADFAETMSLLEAVRFDNLFSFAYSERPGTAAAAFEDSVPVDVRKARLNILQARQRQYTRDFMMRMDGQVVEILVEGPSRFDPEIFSGKTGQNVTVNFRGQVAAGVLARVQVQEVKSNTVFGTLLA